jgi:hypothetical protein
MGKKIIKKNPAFDPCRVFSSPVLPFHIGPVAAIKKSAAGASRGGVNVLPGLN